MSKINDFVQTIGITGGLSSAFVSAISEAYKFDLDGERENTDLKNIEDEILRLNKLLRRNERLLANKEEEELVLWSFLMS